MKPSYKPQIVTKTGWTAWISPLHGSGKRNYRMACCDCELVHEIQFRIEKRKVHSQVLNSVVFRAKRNARATAQLRRRKPREEK